MNGERTAVDRAAAQGAPATAAGSPLAETARRLTEKDRYRRFEVGIPEGDGWIPAAQLLDRGFAAAWFERVAARSGDRRFAAGVLSRAYVSAVVLAWAFPVLAEARLPLSPLEGVRLHVGERSRVDGVALADPRVAVVAGDPAQGLPGISVLGSRDQLWDALAETLAGMEPLLERVREVSGLGWPALWGEVADQVAGSGLWLARLYGRDPWAAWDEAMSVIRRLAAREPRLRVRPRPFPVQWRGGEELHMVRGTCCLHYRRGKAAQPGEELYCVSCPLRPDDWRRETIRASLEGGEGSR